MRVSFYTLGCKVNQNETGALAQLFRQNGYTLAGPDEEADVFVVNSCTVTAGGDKKSRQWLRRAKRQYPGAVTVLTGCYPQAFPEEAAAVMEADVVMGNANRHAILNNVARALEGERVVDIAAHEKGEAFEELPMERFEGHTRAFIKVQDGCNRQCAYCVIPRARGRVRSRSEASIIRELEALAAAGYKEVVFSGINLPSYGQDTGTNLIELIEHSAQVNGIERIRLGSLEPDLLSDEDIARMARELLQHRWITDYTTIWQDTLRGGETELVNTNRLVRFYNGCTGLKTGTTDDAGCCVCASAERDGMTLIAVILGAPDSDTRFESAKSLLDYGFASHALIPPPEVSDRLAPIPVRHGAEPTVLPAADAPKGILVEKARRNDLTSEVELLPEVEAPVEQGQILGSVKILLDGEVQTEYDIIASQGVPRMEFGRAFHRLLGALLGANVE